ncbi:BrnT family toxin [Microbaculum marinum]
MPLSYRPPLEFEWDARKAASNASKHGITFDDGIDLFTDPGHVVWDVSRPEDREVRWKAIGMIDGRIFVAVFVWRAAVARLISVRRANRREERIYGDRKNEA